MTNTPPENLLVHVLKLLVNRVYALAYVQATQCLYVGGDFSGLVYRADDGYSTSVPVSAALICAGSADKEHGRPEPISLQTSL